MSKKLIINEQVSSTDLEVVVTVGKEGISKYCDVFEGAMYYKEWANNFGIEEDSSDVCESQKMQRDLIPSRINKFKKTFKERDDHSLPSIVIFVTKLEILETFNIGNKVVVKALIRANAGRFIPDGQHRTRNAQIQINELNRVDLEDHTVGFKLCVTNTESIYDARKVIEQVFADYNGLSHRPNSSTNKFYDTSTAVGRLFKSLAHFNIEGHGPVSNYVAFQGNIKKQKKLLTNDQFRKFVIKCIGKTESEIEKALSKNPELEETFKTGVINTINGIWCHLPLELVGKDNWNELANKGILSNAIFMEGLALAANAHYEQCKEEGIALSWDVFEPLQSKLPIMDITHELWRKYNVTLHSTDKTGGKKVTINKNGGSRKIALIICNKLKIEAPLDLQM